MNNFCCLECKNNFSDKRKEAKYCSYDCYWKNISGKKRLNRRKRIIKNCVICNNNFEIRECHKRVKTCSIKCGNLKKRGQKRELKDRVEIECIGCSETFKVLPYLKNKQFCKRKCYLDFKSRNVKYPDKQRFQGSKWQKIRLKVIDRDKVCTSCGSDGKEVHHIVPYSISGDDSLENLTLLCKGCHLRVHLKMWEDEKLLKTTK